MQAAVVLVVGPPKGVRISQTEHACGEAEALAGAPFACLDILGQSTYQRTIARLENAGSGLISVVADKRYASWLEHQNDVIELSLVEGPALWQETFHRIEEYLSAGINTIFLLRLGAYLEFDLADILQFHQRVGRAVTRVFDKQGPFDAWVLDLHRAGLQLEELLEHEYSFAAPYFIPGYVNRLSQAQDVRRLVVDSFMSRTAIRPDGVEVRPGVWIAEGAEIDSNTRIVAPAYVGRNARVKGSTLITRSSNIEEGCHIDYGTVVEDATTLSHTYLGTGLDVSHSVVYGKTLVHLRENVMIEIEDSALIGQATEPSVLDSFIRRSNRSKRGSGTQSKSARTRQSAIHRAANGRNY